MFHVFLHQAQEEDYHDGNESDSSVDSGSSSGPNFNYILNMPLWCLTKEKVEELLKQRDQKVSLTIVQYVLYIFNYIISFSFVSYEATIIGTWCLLCYLFVRGYLNGN